MSKFNNNDWEREFHADFYRLHEKYHEDTDYVKLVEDANKFAKKWREKTHDMSISMALDLCKLIEYVNKR